MKASGLPVTYSHWLEGEAPSLPFICWDSPGTNNFAADGKVFSVTNRVRAKLYTLLVDPETEKKLTDALDAADIFWQREENELEDEKCYEITFESEV